MATLITLGMSVQWGSPDVDEGSQCALGALGTFRLLPAMGLFTPDGDHRVKGP